MFYSKHCIYLLCRVGFEVYLVGGCVRDLVLKRTPKDFDIVTSAELKEVSLNFCLRFMLNDCDDLLLKAFFGSCGGKKVSERYL